MTKHYNSLCIIPARGGSKRIPRKNIKSFLGKPIIAYSIEAALEAGIFDEVMVSTDDDEIAKVAEAYGATVPFKRSEKGANDVATIYDVIKEVTTTYSSKQSKQFKYTCCLFATAPFVTAPTLREAYTLLQTDHFESVFSAVKYAYPIQRALVFRDQYLRMLNENNLYKRSQDLEPTYHDAGLFYFHNTAAYLNKKSVFKMDSNAILFEEGKVQDIDTLEDWEIAEFKYKFFQR